MKTLLLPLLAFFLSSQAMAATLNQVQVADCKNQRGSAFYLFRAKGVVTGRFTIYGEVLTNLHEGERMPIEAQRNGENIELGSLVRDDRGARTFGSLMLTLPKGAELQKSMNATMIFRDMEGLVRKELLTCTFIF